MFVLVWLVTQNHSDFVSDTTAVPFLPVNPSYSSTRNQGRQKLALFNAQEFSTLVLDIVIDARRREVGSQLDLNEGMNCAKNALALRDIKHFPCWYAVRTYEFYLGMVESDIVFSTYNGRIIKTQVSNIDFLIDNMKKA